MFKDLRTSTKLVILCGMFLISVGVTTLSLVAEKQIAIDFARKELVGTRYLEELRRIYATVLAEPPFEDSATSRLTDDMLKTLAAAQNEAEPTLQTGEFAQALADSLRLQSSSTDSAIDYASALDVLAKARQLVSRVADDSNLALDPDLDSYHVQDLVTRKVPAFLQQLAEVQILAQQAAAAPPPSREQEVRFQVLEGSLRSAAAEVNGNLAAAYRGNPDGSLKRATEGVVATMDSAISAYLSDLEVRFADDGARDAVSAERLYGKVLTSTISAWVAAQSELDALLRKRIDGFIERMRLSLALIGGLVALSIVIAVMTHRHIVGPLERLERLASTVRETKDYRARLDYSSRNEIGRLVKAFNEMLAELASARERERSEQFELMRVARLTTLGAMSASLAHEINQPLAAIVAHGNAARRWLSGAPPNLEEARAALKSIVNDGHRASQVIGSVRAMFRKDQREKIPLAVNDVIEDVLGLVDGELREQHVTVRTELFRDLPHVVADRIQLLQVFLNLIRNAIEAMAVITNRQRLLVVRSSVHEPGAQMITVEDTGTGIDPSQTERVFEPLFTTKSSGTGLGLAICRSIVETHGGRLWASAGMPHGTVFHVVLPSGS